MNQPPAGHRRNSDETALRRTAWLSVAVHLLAGLAMALVLRHGLETNPDFLDRLRFLVEHKRLWQLAWFPWNLAALAMLYFVVCYRRAHRGHGLGDHALDYALVLCAAAVPLDLTAEAIEMAAIPELAALPQGSEDSGGANPFVQFHVWHRTAVILTGCFANGLYTLSAVMLTWSTCRVHPRWLTAAGFVVGLGGLGLSAAALLDSVMGMFLANVILVPAILLWQSGIALASPGDTSPPMANPSEV